MIDLDAYRRVVARLYCLALAEVVLALVGLALR